MFPMYLVLNRNPDRNRSFSRLFLTTILFQKNSYTNRVTLWICVLKPRFILLRKTGI